MCRNIRCDFFFCVYGFMGCDLNSASFVCALHAPARPVRYERFLRSSDGARLGGAFFFWKEVGAFCTAGYRSTTSCRLTNKPLDVCSHALWSMAVFMLAIRGIDQWPPSDSMQDQNPTTWIIDRFLLHAGRVGGGHMWRVWFEDHVGYVHPSFFSWVHPYRSYLKHS